MSSRSRGSLSPASLGSLTSPRNARSRALAIMQRSRSRHSSRSLVVSPGPRIRELSRPSGSEPSLATGASKTTAAEVGPGGGEVAGGAGAGAGAGAGVGAGARHGVVGGGSVVVPDASPGPMWRLGSPHAPSSTMTTSPVVTGRVASPMSASSMASQEWRRRTPGLGVLPRADSVSSIVSGEEEDLLIPRTQDSGQAKYCDAKPVPYSAELAQQLRLSVQRQVFRYTVRSLRSRHRLVFALAMTLQELQTRAAVDGASTFDAAEAAFLFSQARWVLSCSPRGVGLLTSSGSSGCHKRHRKCIGG